MDFRSEGAPHFGRRAVVLAGLMARVADWRPEDFWNATPADVAAVLAAWTGEEEAARMDSAALAAMMEAFPDG